jgi:hypothetical protein
MGNFLDLPLFYGRLLAVTPYDNITPGQRRALFLGEFHSSFSPRIENIHTKRHNSTSYSSKPIYGGYGYALVAGFAHTNE